LNSENALSKISICPVGTCRINTPLKRGAARFPVQLDYRRIYGFVHTAREAIQQLRYRGGEMSFSPALVPVIFRSGQRCEDKPPVETLPDLTIVEISSIKAYLLGDIAVQGNYLYQHFADFFGRPARARAYLNLARHGDSQAMNAFLESDPVYRRYGAEEREVLANLRMGVQTFEEVRGDMAELVERIGKDRLLFVTHVDVTTPDGSLIASRDKLIRWVKSASAELGVGCFDPTQLMVEFGQERAMQRAGLDSTHYTNAFSDAWFAKVQRDYIFANPAAGGAGTENDGASEASMLAETIAVTLAHYDFLDGSRQLFAALRLHPDDVQLQLLHGQVLARIGDYEAAVKLLSQHVSAPEMTHETRQELLRALIETGDAQGAFDLASQMIGDEYENAEIFEIAGTAAEKLGRVEDAVRYRQLAFRRDPASAGAAVSVLDYYKAAGDSELYDAWLAEVVEVLEDRGDATLAGGLAEWAISRREGYALGRALAVVARKDAGVLPRLIEEAARAEMYGALPGITLMLAGTPSVAEKTARPLRSVAQTWAETAENLLDAGRARDAHALAAACLAVQPNQKVARQISRTVVDRLWADVQAGGGDAAVVALCDAAGDMVYGRRSIALRYSRALVKVGRSNDAQAVAARLHALASNDVDAIANHAYMAALNGDFRVALELYGGLSQRSSDETVRYQNRIQAFISTAGVRGVRYIRTVVAAGRFEDAVATCHLLQKYVLLPQQQISSETARTLSALRVHLRQLDEHEASSREVLEIVTLMLSLAPDDPRLLRRAGIEHMNTEEFERALEFWRRLEAVWPDVQSATNNIQRCEILAKRTVRQSRAVSLAA
jgi:tetratricopeptide (TPR) repeat protein